MVIVTVVMAMMMAMVVTPSRGVALWQYSTNTVE
jgi:hypothetical protein